MVVCIQYSRYSVKNATGDPHVINLKTQLLGGCTFRGGKRWLAIPVKHKTLPSLQNSFREFHVGKWIFNLNSTQNAVFITFPIETYDAS